MTANTVLLVTASYDLAPEYVGAALERRGVPFFRLDTDRFPSEVQASFDPQRGLSISDGDMHISHREVKSVWYRRNVAPNLPEDLDVGSSEFCEREARMFLEGALTSLPTQRWLSSPQAIWLAERKPYTDNSKVRVAGPFTVESISPHRVLGVDENGDIIDGIAETKNGYGVGYDFGQVILENLKRSGVQQAHKEDRINFTSLTPWPGRLVCAEGRYVEGGSVDEDDDAPTGPERRAAVFIGPEFGTVSRPDLVEAAREAAECQFDVLIACAFNYDAHTTEFESLGRIPVLKARMNADLHMAGELKNTGNGNLFVIFGEPDIDVLEADDGQVQVRVNGVDVFQPNTGEVRSDGPEGIACWFIDTDYNEESFFVRHAYFLGAGDPYKSLKTTLRAEIDEDAWATLHSATSRPFPKPESGRIAVKVINHLGDEVMKVFRVG